MPHKKISQAHINFNDDAHINSFHCSHCHCHWPWDYGQTTQPVILHCWSTVLPIWHHRALPHHYLPATHTPFQPAWEAAEDVSPTDPGVVVEVSKAIAPGGPACSLLMAEFTFSNWKVMPTDWVTLLWSSTAPLWNTNVGMNGLVMACI